MKTRISSFGVTVLGLATVGLFGGSASWNADGSGEWSNEDNWLQSSGLNMIFPNGKEDVATFPQFNIKKPSTITVGGTFDVATLSFDSEYKYSLVSGTLNVYQSIVTTGEVDIASNLVLQNNVTIKANGNCVITGNISGNQGLIKQGAADLTISGKNSYEGSTVLQSGLLQAGSANAFSPMSSVVIANTSGVVFSLNNYNNKIASLSGGGNLGGNVLLGSATLTVGNESNTVYDGIIFGKGGLVKVGDGILTLSGLNAYTGTTEIQGGILQAGAVGALSSKSTVILANQMGATLDLCGYNNTIPCIKGGGVLGGNICLGKGVLTVGDKRDMTFSGTISGEGGLVKQGAGTLTLDRMNTYTGPTTIAAGALEVLGMLSSPVTVNEKTTLKGSGLIVGDVINYGSVKPGDGAGVLTVTGNQIQKNGSTLDIGLSGKKPDKLVTLGTFTIEDNVVLNVVLPANPVPGTMYEIVSAGGGIVGTFTKVNLPKQFLVKMTSHTIVIEMK